MGQDADKIWHGDDKPNWQAYSGIEAGLDLDSAQIINAVGQGVLVTGEEWRFEYVNPAFARMVGKPLADLIGRTMNEFILPEDMPLLVHERSKRLAGETSTYEFRLRRSDGKIVYVHATGVPRSLGDRVVGSISVITDLTEQNNSENALEETENKYEAIFENTGAATVILEENSIISLANEEFEKLTGYPKEEIEGKKSWTEFVVKDDLERMRTQHRLRRDNTDIALKNYEFRLMDKTGQIKDILLTIDMIPGTRKSVASLLDITERKQMEEALKAERDRAEKYLNIAEVILVALDTRARITLLNRRGYEILSTKKAS